MKTKHSKGTWKVGKSPTVVVTDNGHGFPANTGHDDVGYYGGFLIAESILKVEDAKLIAAAPELLEALQVCYASLCTYGRHPLIEKQVEAAIKKSTE